MRARRSLPLLIAVVLLLSGCGSLPKASYRGCFDCHHKERRCPRLAPPVRSEVDVEVIFPAGTDPAIVDGYRKVALASSDVKSLELISAEGAAAKYGEKSPSLEMMLFRGAGPDALLGELKLKTEDLVYLRIPLAGQLRDCGDCHKKDGRYDVHEVHKKADVACTSCHVAGTSVK